MHVTENEKIVKQFYNCMLEKNVAGAMALLDEYIIWIEPGAPDVPFGGVYNGLDGIGRMFGSEAKTVQLMNFIPKNYFASQNLVVVLGSDSATVLSTGKTYSTDWTMFFTILDGKISMVQTYMDTNAIAKAFAS
jgi:ketosteroid isomerase-like protein